MRRLTTLLVITFFGMSIAAKADTIKGFALNETYDEDNGQYHSTVAGKIDIDIDTGRVVDGNVTLIGEFASYFNLPFTYQNADPGNDPTFQFGYEIDPLTYIGFFNGQEEAVVVVYGSLVDYGGGLVCSVTNLAHCHDENYDVTLSSVNPDLYVQSGSLTPTPEPSGLLLLATGLAGLGCIGRRRTSAVVSERLD